MRTRDVLIAISVGIVAGLLRIGYTFFPHLSVSDVLVFAVAGFGVALTHPSKRWVSYLLLILPAMAFIAFVLIAAGPANLSRGISTGHLRGAFLVPLAAAIGFLVLGRSSHRTIACAEDPSSRSEPQTSSERSAPYTHRASGLQFPAEIGVFRRDKIHHYNEAQTDTSVEYDSISPETSIASMVYVYPAPYSGASHEQALNNQFEQVKSEIRQVYNTAEQFEESEYRAGETLGRVLSFQAERELVIGRGPEAVSSVLYLFEINGWFVKYRATCPVAQKDQLPAELTRLITAIGWPKGT